jgi:hypothetical protein
MKNPWIVDMCGTKCQTSGSHDRVEAIKASIDVKWLKAVAAWPDNGKTVQKAVERRLRVLDRAYERGCHYHGNSKNFPPPPLPKPLGQMCYQCNVQCGRRNGGLP